MDRVGHLGESRVQELATEGPEDSVRRIGGSAGTVQAVVWGVMWERMSASL